MPSLPSSHRGRPADPATQLRWEQRLQRFARSGLTVADFCDREGVSVPSFYAWQRRLRSQTPPATPDADSPNFVPVHLVNAASAPSAELLLPSGCVLRLSPEVDLVWLRQLLDLLGVTPC
jgi:transposase